MSQDQKFPSGGWLNLYAAGNMQQIEFILQSNMIAEEIDHQILNTNKKEG